MQDEPEKTFLNYNEFFRDKILIGPHKGVVEVEAVQGTEEWYKIVNTGMELVNGKINEILGSNNLLTNGRLDFPRIIVIETDPNPQKVAGHFLPNKNEITLVSSNINNDPLSRTKVFIHEYIHFLSHNGRDDSEQVSSVSPIAQNNNIGFRRIFGLDIREGKEGEVTYQYFLSFNEAVTGQLARDILPGYHETYSDYLGLLKQVIDDAITLGLGSSNKNGIFQAWSREQFKDYIYKIFLKGDLAGFTNLLKTIYAKYDITEQQFGLMTHRDDLPSVIEQKILINDPDSPPPTAGQVAILVQQRLDQKTPDDYVTDIIDPEPGDKPSENEILYGSDYDDFIKTNNIVAVLKETIEGIEYDIDNVGLIIYRDKDASKRLKEIKDVFDRLLVELENDEVDLAYITEKIDELLFKKYKISMLSDGFRDFYIYKHSKIGRK